MQATVGLRAVNQQRYNALVKSFTEASRINAVTRIVSGKKTGLQRLLETGFAKIVRIDQLFGLRDF